MIRMVREPSEVPNITNVDDIVPMRYAYGGQDGYVIAKGDEVNATVNGNIITIKSGRLVLQGVESNIDVNGVTFTIDNLNMDRHYVIYYEVNLGANQTNLNITPYSTTGIPTVEAGDDLTATPSGIARMPIYNVFVQNNIISIDKVVKPIRYESDRYDEKFVVWTGNKESLVTTDANVAFDYVYEDFANIFKPHKTYEIIGTMDIYEDVSNPSGNIFVHNSSGIPFKFKMSFGNDIVGYVIAEPINVVFNILLYPYVAPHRGINDITIGKVQLVLRDMVGVEGININGRITKIQEIVF
jgi:hypothetical protein